MNVPLLPPVTTTSLVVKPLTGSLNVNVNVTGPDALPGVSSVIATVGAERSIVIASAADALETLPTASVIVAVSVFAPSAPRDAVGTST